MNTTHVAFCLDKSGSVSRIVCPLIDAFNSNVDGIKESVSSRDLEATISTFAFCDRTLYTCKPIHAVKPLNYSSLHPSGMTPLFDSVYNAIKELERLDDGDIDTAFIITAVTDGFENYSHNPGVLETIREIERKIASDRWTFTFMVPNSKITAFKRDYPMLVGNIKGWDETSAEGTKEAFIMNTVAYDQYFGLRSKGVTATRTFYSDLGNVKAKDVVGKMGNISNDVQFYTINKTMQIRDMYEEITGQTYVKGTAFYKLVKTEKIVQPYKFVVIRNQKTGIVYAGSRARNLLGIALDHNIRLAPGDHGEWDIFIQSTSVNRKMLPGNILMVWMDAPKYQN